MVDIKQILKFNNFTIEVIENKAIFIESIGITEEQVSSYNIDTRIFLAMENFRDDPSDLNRTLVVYDYDRFKEESYLKNALLYHEIGHLFYPGIDIQQELKCDKFAADFVGPQAVYDALNLAIKEMSKITSDLNELEIRKLEIKKFL